MGSTAVKAPRARFETDRSAERRDPSFDRLQELAPAVQEGVEPEIGRKQAALVERLFGPPVDAALEDRMGEIAAPTLALFGARDELIPTAYARRYKALMPKAHAMFVYDAGRAITEDRPEAAASIIEDFLEEPGGFLVNRQSGALGD